MAVWNCRIHSVLYAGFATVHVYGMGNSTGELTDTFEIDKAMPQMASYGQKEAIVGQPVDIRFDAKPEGKCTYEVYKDGSDEQTDQYTKLNENGELHGYLDKVIHD